MRGARGIYDAATDFNKNFKEGYEANMSWLSEVHEEALRIINTPEVWLPRTPGTKKIKRTFAHIATWNQESTFHEGSEKKKLKIDDFSTIDNDNSMVDTNSSICNASRTLRPRPQKPGKIAQQKKQSKRIAKKMDNRQDKVQSIVTSQAFIPPLTIKSICLNASSNDSTLKINSPYSNRKIQSKVPTGVKLFKKVDFGDTIVKNSEALFTDTCLEGKNEKVQETNSPRDSGEVLSRNTVLINDSSVGDQSFVENNRPVPITVNDTLETEPDANAKPVSSSTPDVKERKEVIVIQASPLYSRGTPARLRSPAKCFKVPPYKDEVQSSPEEVFSSPLQNNNRSVPQEPLSSISPGEGGVQTPVEVAKSLPKKKVVNNTPQPVSTDMSTKEDRVRSPGEVSFSLPQNDDGASPDNTVNQEPLSNKNKDDVDSSDAGRRGTYKIIVNNIIEGPPKKLFPDTDKSIMSNACNTDSGNRMEKDVKKFPKVVKPVRGGNIVSNIKTFIKRPDSPKQAEIDYEKKGLSKQKAMEEIQKKKQMQVEERKRQQEEREKRFADQQKRIQDEEETKRKQLKLKAEQIAKNQEEIRKMREQEQKRKREMRENKKADIDARRQKEDEEKERKANELLQDEKRKEESLQRKAELEEQKRLELKAEKEKLGKEKLLKIEQYKMYDEERLKREFEEKEKHRFDVEVRKKEDKEKERLEKLNRDERNRQAEKEIADARKLEEERIKREEEGLKREEEGLKREEERVRKEEGRKRREEERIRVMEEAKEKAKALAKERKLILNKPVADPLRSSPRLKAQNCPQVPLVQRDSSAFVNYGLDDFDSGDSTDDDCSPAKRVPSWALGSRLNKQLMRQFYTDIEPDEIFVNAMAPLRLEIIFNKSKTRYFKRTSSAHWGSPPIRSIFKPRK